VVLGACHRRRAHTGARVRVRRQRVGAWVMVANYRRTANHAYCPSAPTARLRRAPPHTGGKVVGGESDPNMNFSATDRRKSFSSTFFSLRCLGGRLRGCSSLRKWRNGKLTLLTPGATFTNRGRGARGKRTSLSPRRQQWHAYCSPEGKGAHTPSRRFAARFRRPATALPPPTTTDDHTAGNDAGQPNNTGAEVFGCIQSGKFVSRVHKPGRDSISPAGLHRGFSRHRPRLTAKNHTETRRQDPGRSFRPGTTPGRAWAFTAANQGLGDGSRLRSSTPRRVPCGRRARPESARFGLLA